MVAIFSHYDLVLDFIRGTVFNIPPLGFLFFYTISFLILYAMFFFWLSISSHFFPFLVLLFGDCIENVGKKIFNSFSHSDCHNVVQAQHFSQFVENMFRIFLIRTHIHFQSFPKNHMIYFAIDCIYNALYAQVYGTATTNFTDFFFVFRDFEKI